MTDAICHVVVQTHWDREWYFTREQYLARLLRAAPLFANELENGQLDSFMFDGQTIAVEDLLDACEPEVALRLRALMMADRIVLGPWYVSADEFLVDGECLIRNLERGMASATALGNCQRVGYIPDTFGHIAQLPQILNGFGIDTAVLWRGSDHPLSEMIWQSPGGGRVFAVVLTQGYYQHPFNVPDWQTALTAYCKSVLPAATTPHLLLTQGGDHLVTAENIADRITAFNAAQNSFRLQQTRLADYIDIVQAHANDLTNDLAIVHGELRQNQRAFVLPDILSTRRYLKLANQQAEDRMLGLIEPLLAITEWTKIPYPQHYLSRTWDMLLQQQAHDSICGCSIDAVHVEMMTRFAALAHRLDALIDLALVTSGKTNELTGRMDSPSPFADQTLCTLFNPAPKNFSGWFEASVFIAGDSASGLAAKHGNGTALEMVVLSAEPHKAFTSPLDDFPDHVSGHRYHVAVRADLCGMAMVPITIFVVDIGLTSPPATVISNKYYAINLQETGTALVLTDRATGQKFADVCVIESTLDAGDSYNYAPPSCTQGSDAHFTLARVTGTGTSCETMVLDVVLDQPAGLSTDRTGPADEQVRSHGCLTLVLLADEPLVRATLTWHNAAQDHRLRLKMALPEAVDSTASDGGFSWTTRPLILPDVPDELSRSEARVSVNPSHSVIVAGPFGFLHRGLQEFEVERTAAVDLLGITLLRSVGWLSRRDLVTRGVGAGPDMTTPGAQCLGEHRFDFAFGLQTGAVTLLNQAAAWRRPPTLLQGHAGSVPAQITIADDRLQVSSLRRVAAALELRVWNPTDDAVCLDLPGWQVRAVTFAHEPQMDWDGAVQPYGIQTVLLSRVDAGA